MVIRGDKLPRMRPHPPPRAPGGNGEGMFSADFETATWI
jgi:hypothetical protein